MYTYPHIQLNMFTDVHVYTYVQAQIHACMHMCVHIHTQIGEASTERRENKHIIKSTIFFLIKFRQIGNTFTKVEQAKASDFLFLLL